MVEAISLYEEASRKKKEELDEAKLRKNREEEERVKALDMRNASFETLGGKRAAAGTNDSEGGEPIQKKSKAGT